MYMILVCPYLKKLDLVPRLYFEAYLFQNLIHFRVKYRSAIFRRKYQVV